MELSEGSSPGWSIAIDMGRRLRGTAACLALSLLAGCQGLSSWPLAGSHEALVTQPPIRFAFSGQVHVVAFTHQGRRLAIAGCADSYDPTPRVCSTGLLDVWDIEKAQVVQSLRYPDPVTAFAVAPDGEGWALGDGDGRVLLSKEPAKVTARPIHQSDEITALAFSPDGRWLASGSRDTAYPLGLMDPASGGMIRTRTRFEPVSALAFSPDGGQLVVGMAKGGLVSWEYRTSSHLIDLVPNHGSKGNEVTSLAFSRDGALLAYGRRDGKLGVLLFGLKQPLVEARGMSAVTAVAFSPNGRYLAVGFDNGKVQVIEPKESRLMWSRQHALPITSLAFSPGDQALAVGVLQGVYLYPLETPAEVGIQGAGEGVRAARESGERSLPNRPPAP